MALNPMAFERDDRMWCALGSGSSESGSVSNEWTQDRRTPTDIILVGRAGGLREEAARHLGTASVVTTQVDHSIQLTEVLEAMAGTRPLVGRAIVLVTDPFLPGFFTGLRRRHRARVLSEKYSSLARAAHDLGADRFIVCSTAFLYADDGGCPLLPSSPIKPGSETVAAQAAEGAAQMFTTLGGRSVILRLGWVFGDDDPITQRVVETAGKGWQLIDGGPGNWVTSIARADAATAIQATMAAPPGIYNVSDGRPVTQAAINAELNESTQSTLYSLFDPHWGETGVLFGRRVCSPTMASVTSPAGGPPRPISLAFSSDNRAERQAQGRHQLSRHIYPDPKLAITRSDSPLIMPMSDLPSALPSGEGRIGRLLIGKWLRFQCALSRCCSPWGQIRSVAGVNGRSFWCSDLS